MWYAHAMAWCDVVCCGGGGGVLMPGSAMRDAPGQAWTGALLPFLGSRSRRSVFDLFPLLGYFSSWAVALSTDRYGRGQLRSTTGKPGAVK